MARKKKLWLANSLRNGTTSNRRLVAEWNVRTTNTNYISKGSPDEMAHVNALELNYYTAKMNNYYQIIR